MRPCLIVANETLTTDTLTRAVEERIAAEPYHVFFSSRRPPRRRTSRRTRRLRDPGALAGGPRVRPGPAAPRPRTGAPAGPGAAADGEVGGPDPLQAVRLTLGRFPADGIIISTLPRGLSHWIRRDLPARLRKGCGIPVTHLVTGPDANASANARA